MQNKETKVKYKMVGIFFILIFLVWYSCYVLGHDLDNFSCLLGVF